MYKIKVNASNTFEISKETLETLDVVETSINHYHILQDNTSIKAQILATDFSNKIYSIKVNNNTYDVNIYDALDQQIEALGFETGISKQVNNIKAPMPGLILEISADRTIILCTKIVMNPEEKEEIKKPEKGQVVTQEEYTEITTKKIEEMREMYGGRGGRGGGGRRN